MFFIRRIFTSQSAKHKLIFAFEYVLLLSFVTYTAQVFQGFEVTVGDGDDGLE